MNEFFVILIILYACIFIFGIIWLLCDDGEFMGIILKKNVPDSSTYYTYDDFNTEDYIKLIWLYLLWPVIFVIWFITKGLKPLIKFIIKCFLFIVKIIFYPVYFLYKYSIPYCEKYGDKLGMWLVKKFNL